MTLAHRKLDVEFRLGKGNFGDSGFNTVKLPSGLRIRASIMKTGGYGMTTLQLAIRGMTLSLMNQISTLGKLLVDGRNNQVTVSAGSDSDGMAVVFSGTIFQAWANMQASPDVVFELSAIAGFIQALAPIPPTSFQGQADVALVMSGLANQMGLAFENTGVSVRLANPYFPGTARDQALACAQAANINMLIDDTTLAIWPKDAARRGSRPLISKDTGLVGYPAWTDNGIVFQTIFNPSILFGAEVEIKSIIAPASGVWAVFNLTHFLESETPDGDWFTKVECTVIGHVAIPK